MTIRVPRQPVLGENIVGDSFDLGPGGKGTNQAIAAARLGADVNLMACIGDDLFSNIARDLYAQDEYQPSISIKFQVYIPVSLL